MEHMTESEALQDCLGYEDFNEDNESHREADLSNLSKNPTQLYQSNKKARIGAEIKCPTCGTMFKKKVKGHTFCNTKKRRSICKDTYHNSVDETRRNRANIYTGYRR